MPMRTVGRPFCAHAVPDDKIAVNRNTIIKPNIEPPLSCAVVTAIRQNCQADTIGATHFAFFVLSATKNKSHPKRDERKESCRYMLKSKTFQNEKASAQAPKGKARWSRSKDTVTNVV